MYQVHTKIGRYDFVHTAETLAEAKMARQMLFNMSDELSVIAYITDANGEMV